MLYVITEDSNSGRQFWRTVPNTMLGKAKFQMIELPMDEQGVKHGGNINLGKQVTNTLLEKASEGDTILVAFDNIEESVRKNGKTGKVIRFDPEEFIDSNSEKCRDKGGKIYIYGILLF